MPRIAMVKIRTAHDVELTLGATTRTILQALTSESTISRLQAQRGAPAVPQMTLPYLAALVEQHQRPEGPSYECVVIDEPEGRVERRLTEDRPWDMIWFTTNTPSAPATYRLSGHWSRQGVITVLGGIHVSVLPEEAAPFATTVVTGEAENVVGPILRDFEQHGRPQSFYKGGLAPSLAGLPPPAWDRLGYRPLVLSTQTSRGCRNACGFCSTTRFQGIRRRHRPVSDVVDEIKWHRDQGNLDRATVFFNDNNIVSDTDHRRGRRDTAHARQLFEALVPLNISWAGQGEINLADDPELVALAAESGLQTLLVGFETLDQDNLASVNKPSNSVDRYAEQIQVMRSYGISLIGCFIFGMDHDTPAVFDRTARFIQKHVDSPQLSIITPYPGTAWYKKLRREGRLLHDDWSRFDVLNVTHRPLSMTPEQLRDGFARLTNQVYSLPRVLSRAARFSSAVRFGRNATQTWRERFARALGINLYYRALFQAVRPSMDPALATPDSEQSRASPSFSFRPSASGVHT